ADPEAPGFMLRGHEDAPPIGGQITIMKGAKAPYSSAFGRRPLPSLGNQSRPGKARKCKG
ncbi:hypothetical protein, partial [Enterobacter hormaechei]|uniref:hypothetical protein n=1 Tax=Enterobacter hormaechei TaxID=158836 RepID=UPI001BAED4F1